VDYIKMIRNLVKHTKIILVSSGAFVFDDNNKVLLQCRSDNHCWCVPGGFVELNESIKAAAKREVFEETGLIIDEENMSLFSIYSGPSRDAKLNNGDEIANIQIVFICKKFTGKLLQKASETYSTEFFSMDALPENMHFNQKEMISDLLEYHYNKSALPIIK